MYFNINISAIVVELDDIMSFPATADAEYLYVVNFELFLFGI